MVREPILYFTYPLFREGERTVAIVVEDSTLSISYGSPVPS